MGNLRIAAIDIGSNAVRVTCIQIDATGAWLPLRQARYGLRLGPEAFANGRLLRQPLRGLLTALHKTRALLRSCKVDTYRAVATASLRRVADPKALVEALERRSNIWVEIISPQEEVRLAKSALLRAAGCVPNLACMDLGGGSLELSDGIADGPWISLPWGTLEMLARAPRLTQALSPDEFRAILDKLGNALRSELAASPTGATLLAKASGPGCATGGHLRAFAYLSNRNASTHTRFLDIHTQDLFDLADKLSPLPAAERCKLLALRADRADTILASLAVATLVSKLLSRTRWATPGTGLRDAILVSLANPKPAAEFLGSRPSSGVQDLRKLMVAFEGWHGLAIPHEDFLAQTDAAARRVAQSYDHVIPSNIQYAELCDQIDRIQTPSSRSIQHMEARQRAIEALASLALFLNALKKLGCRWNGQHPDLLTPPIYLGIEPLEALQARAHHKPLDPQALEALAKALGIGLRAPIQIRMAP